MTVNITLEHNFGHPDNEPTKAYLLLKVLAAMKTVQIDSNQWYITKIEVE
jgi:hypothetical protein